MSGFTQPDCTVHPGVGAAAPCTRCRHPFCAACLTEHQGYRLCVSCYAVATGTLRSALPEQRTDFRGTGRVDLGRWISAGWYLLLAQVGPWMLTTLLVAVVSLVTCMVTAPALSCGMYQMAFRQIRGERIAPEQVFGGFRRFGSSFCLGLLLAAPILPCYGFVLFNFFQVMQKMQVREPSMTELMTLGFLMQMGYLVMFVIGLLLMSATFFAYPRLAAVPLGPIAALSASWQVVRRNFMKFLWTAFVLLILQGLGAAAFYIGIFFTVPLTVLAWAQAYVDHFGLQDAQLEG